MKKIVLVPLDERPVNYLYPNLIGEGDYEICLPPREYLGDKKKAGDVKKISDWLVENSKDADVVIVSIDTLIFGGIVPSRLHHETYETLHQRIAVIPQIKKNNPKMKLFGFELIMRCPGYNSAEEEPDYYEEYGSMIHRYGECQHKESLGLLTEEEKEEFAKLKETLPKEYLDDYVNRRHLNTDLLLTNLEYVKEGVFDFFIVPQDDSTEYGFTILDQIRVRKYFADNHLEKVTAMYPSADDTGLTMLARAVCTLNGYSPKIFVKYASEHGGECIPWFEDRALDKTMNYQISSAGAERVYSFEEADIVLGVTMVDEMLDFDNPRFHQVYEVQRDIPGFISFLKEALAKGKVVTIGDNATANGADHLVFDELHKEGLLYQIHGYAAWNTSSNTLGTCICQSILYYFYRDEKKNQEFLTYRYYEDCGYMTYTRGEVSKNYLPSLGLNYFKVDGKQGKVPPIIKKVLMNYMAENYPEVAAKVSDIHVRQPWERMFETELKIDFKDE